ncbi:MAG: DUF6491 family protein [Pseudomonadota bacterium]
MPGQSSTTARQPVRRSLGLLLLIAAAVSLMPPAFARSSGAAQPDAESLALPGLPVDSIRGVEEISAIEVLDTYQLSFRVNRSAHYLVQFAPACTLLPYARSIAMSSTAGTIQAGFDSVAADGQQCRINRIYRL